MKRLLASTAVALALGTTAFAQESTGAMSYEAQASDFYATALIGARIYATETPSEDEGAMIDVNAGYSDIGEINDFVVGEDGSVNAVIVGVGGFLGIGEKDVAIPMDDLMIMNGEAGERYLVVTATADTLNEAPAFEYPEVGTAMTTDGAAEGDPEAAMDADTDAVDMTAETEEVVTTSPATTDGAADTGADDLAQMEPATANTAAAEEVEEISEGDEMAASETTIESNSATDLAEVEAVEGDQEVEPLAEAETMEEASDMMAEPEVLETETTETGMVEGGATMVEGYTTVAVTDLTTDQLTGASVLGMNDENLGDIGDLVVAEDGTISGAIVDFGGFLGIGVKQVEVSFDDLEIMQNADGSDIRVLLDATREQLEAMPEYEG